MKESPRQMVRRLWEEKYDTLEITNELNRVFEPSDPYRESDIYGLPMRILREDEESQAREMTVIRGQE